MAELGLALGVILVFEGVLYALFPDAMKRMMALVLTLPPETLRNTGLMVAASGVFVIWLIKRVLT